MGNFLSPLISRMRRPFAALDANGLLPADEAGRLLGIPQDTLLNWCKILDRNLLEEEFSSIEPVVVGHFDSSRIKISSFHKKLDRITGNIIGSPAYHVSKYIRDNYMYETLRIAKIFFGSHAISNDIIGEARYVKKGQYLIPDSAFVHRDSSHGGPLYIHPEELMFVWSSRDSTAWVNNSLEARKCTWQGTQLGNRKKIIDLPRSLFMNPFPEGSIVMATDQHFHGAVPARESMERVFLVRYVGLSLKL